MTRKEFEKKAIREAERKLQIPRGWWGTWTSLHGPRGVTVRFARGTTDWIVRRNGVLVSRHTARAVAIANGQKSKARKA